VSSAIRPLGGCDPQDLIGNHYQEIIHPDDWARAAKAFARVLRGDRRSPLFFDPSARMGPGGRYKQARAAFLRIPL